jgi:hypothetical protein
MRLLLSGAVGLILDLVLFNFIVEFQTLSLLDPELRKKNQVRRRTQVGSK